MDIYYGNTGGNGHTMDALWNTPWNKKNTCRVLRQVLQSRFFFRISFEGTLQHQPEKQMQQTVTRQSSNKDQTIIKQEIPIYQME